ncbi:MAG: YMGG-like glycine zipper-containing protein [Rhizomicrobium sp.]
MRLRAAALTALSTVVLLAGCATQPRGPEVPVMPGPGKTNAAFEQDESYCENYAANRASGKVQQANDTELRNGVVGAALGAGIGALAGNTKGALIGGGIGAVLGSASGSGYDQAHVQRVYDIGYAQCMKARGNNVPMRHPRRWRDAPPPDDYAPPPGGDYPPPPGDYPPPPPPPH